MTAFAWTAIATIFVFTASQIIQLIINIKRRGDHRNALCKSLRAEINVILSLIGEANSTSKFEAFINEKSVAEINATSFVALRSSIYKQYAKELNYLDMETVGLVTKFYCLFDIFNGFIDHFKTEEFLNSSADTQNVMKGFFIQNVKDMHETGAALESRLRA